jgi:hypothetical protein
LFFSFNATRQAPQHSAERNHHNDSITTLSIRMN